MRKNICSRAIYFLFSASLMVITIPNANAAISNGVKCSKENAIAKVGSKVYRCTKNPIVKPKVNTWTLRGCVSANKLLVSSKEQYEDWKDILVIVGEEGAKTLSDLQTSIIDLENFMKNEVCKKGA